MAGAATLPTGYVRSASAAHTATSRRQRLRKFLPMSPQRIARFAPPPRTPAAPVAASAAICGFRTAERAYASTNSSSPIFRGSWFGITPRLSSLGRGLSIYSGQSAARIAAAMGELPAVWPNTLLACVFRTELQPGRPPHRRRASRSASRGQPQQLLDAPEDPQQSTRSTVGGASRPLARAYAGRPAPAVPPPPLPTSTGTPATSKHLRPIPRPPEVRQPHSPACQQDVSGRSRPGAPRRTGSPRVPPGEHQRLPPPARALPP